MSAEAMDEEIAVEEPPESVALTGVSCAVCGVEGATCGAGRALCACAAKAEEKRGWSLIAVTQNKRQEMAAMVRADERRTKPSE